MLRENTLIAVPVLTAPLFDVSDEDLRRMGPLTRKILRYLRQPGATPAWAVYRVLGARPRPGRRREAPAVGTVLAQAAREVAHEARTGLTDRAYDLYFREDLPLGDTGSLSLSESLVRALRQGEAALAKLVAQKAAEVLGRNKPSRRLRVEVSRRIELCELLAYEASRLGLW